MPTRCCATSERNANGSGRTALTVTAKDRFKRSCFTEVLPRGWVFPHLPRRFVPLGNSRRRTPQDSWRRCGRGREGSHSARRVGSARENAPCARRSEGRKLPLARRDDHWPSSACRRMRARSLLILNQGLRFRPRSSSVIVPSSTSASSSAGTRSINRATVPACGIVSNSGKTTRRFSQNRPGRMPSMAAAPGGRSKALAVRPEGPGCGGALGPFGPFQIGYNRLWSRCAGRAC